jgi:hypothetical protein
MKKLYVTAAMAAILMSAYSANASDTVVEEGTDPVQAIELLTEEGSAEAADATAEDEMPTADAEGSEEATEEEVTTEEATEESTEEAVEETTEE